MANVYFLPGFAGSELSIVPATLPQQLIWLDRGAILGGKFLWLALGDDGVSPPTSLFEMVIAGKPLDEYFAVQEAAFAAQLAGQKDRLISVGYDWRIKLDFAAAALVGRITAEVLPAFPCSIVGYSFGGLVARRAWYFLNQQGQANLVRRIVQIGAPNYGSYGTPWVWSFGDPYVGEIYRASQLNPFLEPIKPFTDFAGPYNTLDIRKICMSWPAMYEALPALFAPDAAGDPGRAQLYDRGLWDPQPPMQKWLQYATGAWQAWLLSPASIPPGDVLTCVVGTGTATPYRLRLGSAPSDYKSYDMTNDGDGRVTVAQATLPGAAVVTLSASHGDMYGALVSSGQLLALVNEQRTPSPAPPAAVTISGIVPRYAQDPPAPPSVFIGTIARPGNWHPGQDP